MTLKTNSPNLGVLVSGAAGDQHFQELLRQWRALDALVQPSVVSRIAAVPTSGAVDGDRYLLTAEPNSGKIARYSADPNSITGWEYFAPGPGWRVHVASEKVDYQFVDGAWRVASAGGGGAVSSVAGRTGDVVLSKVDVGLPNADDTPDAQKPVSAAQQTALDKKVDKLTGYGLSQANYTTEEKTKLAGLESSRFKGVFVSLAALTAGVSSPGAGDYADVDPGAGADAVRYIWDVTDNKWVKSGAADPITAAQVKALYESNPDTNGFTNALKARLDALTSSDGLLEGASNKYFTGARVLSTVLSGLASGANVVIAATDQLLIALAKLQAQVSARALKGVNNDITELQGLSVPLSLAQGGTGSNSGVPEMSPSTSTAAGAKGLVPAPPSGGQQFLSTRGWATPSGAVTEDTFTPGLSLVSTSGVATPVSSSLISVAFGSYSRIGNRVFFELLVRLGGTLPSGAATDRFSVTGLPLAAKGYSSNPGADLVYPMIFQLNNGTSSAITFTTCSMSGGLSAVSLQKYAAGMVSNLTLADVVGSAVFRVSGSYMVVAA